MDKNMVSVRLLHTGYPERNDYVILLAILHMTENMLIGLVLALFPSPIRRLPRKLCCCLHTPNKGMFTVPTVLWLFFGLPKLQFNLLGEDCLYLQLA